MKSRSLQISVTTYALLLCSCPAILADEAASETNEPKEADKADNINAYLNAGQRYYADKKYALAYQYLKAGLAKDPENLRCAYLLANVCLQLRLYEEARDLYETCLAEKPDPALEKNIVSAHKYCAKMLAGGSAQPSHTSPTSPTPPSGAPSSSLANGEASAKTSHEIELEQHKKRIMDDAEKRCAEIRKQGEEQLEEAQSTSNIYRRNSTGGRVTTVSQSVRDQITKEVNEKILKVKEDAKREAANVR